MDSIYKSLKDAKRRVLQVANESIDPNAKTVDEEFDIHAVKFPEMVKDMNECGASLNSSLMHQKQMFSDSESLARSLARIYTANINMTDWDNTTCRLQQNNAAQAYSTAWSDIHNIARSSSAMVCAELGLEPLRAAVTIMQPEIESKCKDRNTKLIDFDSYRRRVKQLHANKEKLETKINNSDSESSRVANEKSLESTIAEIARFEAKLAVSEELYCEQNKTVKEDIVKAKLAHDQLIDMVLITTIVCQAEMFSRAANQLNSIVGMLPPDKVDQVRNRIERYVSQGGVRVGTAADAIGVEAILSSQSTAEKGMAIFTGKSSVGDIKKAKEEKNRKIQEQNEAYTKAQQLVKEDEDIRNNSYPVVPDVSIPSTQMDTCSTDADNNSTPTSTSTSNYHSNIDSGVYSNHDLPIATPIGSSAKGNDRPISIVINGIDENGKAIVVGSAKFKVLALYDHEGAEEDELTFVVNDTLDVLDDTDEGWWYGRNVRTQKCGLFPLNYVKKL